MLRYLQGKAMFYEAVRRGLEIDPRVMTALELQFAGLALDD